MREGGTDPNTAFDGSFRSALLRSRSLSPVTPVAFRRDTNSLAYRGRGGGPGCPAPAVRAIASGSYLECLTANRRSGHGCRMRTGGHSSSVILSSLPQANRCCWERRRKTAIRICCNRRTNARSPELLTGTA